MENLHFNLLLAAFEPVKKIKKRIYLLCNKIELVFVKLGGLDVQESVLLYR